MSAHDPLFTSRDEAINAVRNALTIAVFPGLDIKAAHAIRDEAWDALAYLAMEKAE